MEKRIHNPLCVYPCRIWIPYPEGVDILVRDEACMNILITYLCKIHYSHVMIHIHTYPVYDKIKLIDESYFISAVFGNCTIRKNSKLLLDHIYWTGATFSDMYSCTADDNPVYEVHVVAVHSRNSENQNVNITVKQRGLVTKPIVIVLTSYNLSKWWVLSGVPLYRVITNVSTSHWHSLN